MAGLAVDEIKERIDLGEFIGQYVPLRRAGRSLIGLCPFHAEKTPSFNVSPERGFWKCFGCGEGGDLFTFVQKRENLDFAEALRLLAARAGVELPSREHKAPEEQAHEQRLRALLGACELYFIAALQGRTGERAREYLEQRGVAPESMQQFGLGYAPPSGLLRRLQEAGFSADESREAGVAGSRDDGSTYEMFRDRIMFPIRDAAGQTIGFGGRTLGDGQPKYLNGPQTRLFDKSGSLFALDLARGSIRESGQAIVVEGYLDALIAHQHGFRNVVATLGTSLTERHIDMLGRRAREIILALDADVAGQAATLRGLDVARSVPADDVIPIPVPGVRGLIRYQAVRKSQFKVLTLPSGLDPDDLIRQDPAQWASLVSAAMPVVDFVLSRLAERHDLTGPAGKRAAVGEAMAVISDLTDPIEREHYVQRLAALVRLDESGLRQVLSRWKQRRPTRETTESAGSAEGRSTAESHALALEFLSTDAAVRLRADDLPTPVGRAVLTLFRGLDSTGRDESGLRVIIAAAEPALVARLEEVAAWLPRLKALSTKDLERELLLATLKLRQQRLRIEHQQVMDVLSDPSDDAGDARKVLASIAAQIKDIEAALAACNGVGSLVWRSRRAQEVFGG